MLLWYRFGINRNIVHHLFIQTYIFLEIINNEYSEESAISILNLDLTILHGVRTGWYYSIYAVSAHTTNENVRAEIALYSASTMSSDLLISWLWAVQRASSWEQVILSPQRAKCSSLENRSAKTLKSQHIDAWLSNRYFWY